MKSFILFFVLYVIAPQLSEFSGKVVKITDGDTITVLIDQQQIKVRLAGIDCPERSQEYGQFTANQCFSEIVTIIDYGKDRYGRTLGDVKLSNGKLLSHELLKAGLAWHYKHFSNDTLLNRLELEAREKKIGLWLDPYPIPPWEFRKTR